MHFSTTLIAAAAVFFANTAISHPGHDHSAEIAARTAYLEKSTTKRDLSHCSASLKARGVEARAIQRRSKVVQKERAKRALKKRSTSDLDTVLNTTHLSSISNSALTEEATLFSSNASCVLQPEVTQGPYYASGEYVRRNLVESQQGVELIMDIQVIDVNTCNPVVNTMVDFWHCNATGVYSGIVTNGNGDSSDLLNINTTFLRGLQPTQYDGVAQFTTIFPGHYTSRATHIHILTHHNGSILDNSTYTGGTVSHVGQLFFDQDLITQVEATAPYNTNTQDITENSDDSVLVTETDDTTSDPFSEYSLLGDSVEDGVFAWISVGVDLSNQESITPAATYGENGGAESTSSGRGGGGTPPTR